MLVVHMERSCGVISQARANLSMDPIAFDFAMHLISL